MQSKQLWFCMALVILLQVSLGMTHETTDSEARLGKVHFAVSCSEAAQQEFDHAVALLHSFWFDVSAKAFGTVLETDPSCAMAHWGIAMTMLGNPFAWPPAPRVLHDGQAVMIRAQAAAAKTAREQEYIAALEMFYKDADTVEHRTRALAYEQAMEQVARRYPDDREATIFYALALNATALPTDKTYAKQLKAAEMLERIFAEQPEHPGVAHYLIHSYDYPPVAQRGLTAARRYASIAPAAPHALHMPSHIFTRQGLWEESIAANRASAVAAKDHFNQLHAMDYLVYAYLQEAQDIAAQSVLAAVQALGKANVEHFVTAYALAAIPSRYALERRRWADAATLTLPGAEFPWHRFPQSEAVLVFARALGAARSGDVAAAQKETERLQTLHDALVAAKQSYWAEQVTIQRLVASAWAERAAGRSAEALKSLRLAADREDATEKHPVTPGPIVPARELLGEMLLEARQPQEALQEFEASLRVEPNRFKGLYGAARAAELAGNREKAKAYYTQLVALAERADGARPELAEAKGFLAQK